MGRSVTHARFPIHIDDHAEDFLDPQSGCTLYTLLPLDLSVSYTLIQSISRPILP